MLVHAGPTEGAQYIYWSLTDFAPWGLSSIGNVAGCYGPPGKTFTVIFCPPFHLLSAEIKLHPHNWNYYFGCQRLSFCQMKCVGMWPWISLKGINHQFLESFSLMIPFPDSSFIADSTFPLHLPLLFLCAPWFGSRFCLQPSLSSPHFSLLSSFIPLALACTHCRRFPQIQI